jgi:hypothetical protein
MTSDELTKHNIELCTFEEDDVDVDPFKLRYFKSLK